MRFQRRLKIAPGVRLNIGKSGISGLSFGPRGASVSVGKHGTYVNAGTPVSGLSVRSRLDTAAPRQTKRSQQTSLLAAWSGVSLSPNLAEDGALVLVDQAGEQAPDAVAKEAAKQNAEAIARWLDGEVAELNGMRDAIVSLHLKTPDKLPVYVENKFVQPPPWLHPVDDPELPPEAPGWWLGLLHTFLPELRRSWREERKAEVVELLVLHEDEVKRTEARHGAVLAKWEATKAAFEQEEKQRRWLYEEGRHNDPNAMGDFLQQQLGQIEWPRETLIDFDIDGTTLCLDVDLPEIEDLPNADAILRAGGKGIRWKKRSATAVRKDYMTHIHAIGFLLAGTAFISLPSVREVVISGYSQRLDKATGRVDDEYLYSVRIERPAWETIESAHLDRVDPIEALAAFEIRREMTKTGVFRAIEPFAR